MSEHEALLDRYTPSQQEIIRKYWDTIRWTRKSGKIADGIKKTELEFWAQFDTDVVIESLTIHIDKYENIREHYTRGIMRNVAVKKSKGELKEHNSGGSPSAAVLSKKNRFVNYEQRNDWDFDALERLERMHQDGTLDEKYEELMKDPRFAKYLL